MTGRVDVHIDALVLDGVEGVHAAAVSHELTRLIGERGLPGGLHSAARVEATLPAGPADRAVAGAVHEGIRRCST